MVPMSGDNRRVSIDGDLLTAAVARAEAAGIETSTVIEEALRRFLAGGDVLEDIWAALPERLDEAAALDLAYQGLRAVREERRTQAG